MLDSRGGAGDFSNSMAPNQASANQGMQNQSAPVAQPVGAGDFADFDDDIPF